MKMSIARALKERKRIIGEMNTLYNRINSSNMAQMVIRTVDGKYDKPTEEDFAKRRHVSPSKCMEEWYNLREKLIALKTALHNANCGVAEKLVRLSEMKAELQFVENITKYSKTEESFLNENTVRIINVVFDIEWITKRQDQLRKEINELQDAIDEYNATHYIDVFD